MVEESIAGRDEAIARRSAENPVCSQRTLSRSEGTAFPSEGRSLGSAAIARGSEGTTPG